jgi:hypothetical protein
MPSQVENNNNNNNYQYGNENGFYGSYYVAPYCSTKDSKSIFMGVYYDQGCVNKADSSVYASKNYGEELPYSKTSMVATNECIACLVPEENDGNDNGDNNNNNQNYDVTDLCQNSYEAAAKCEKNMDIYYPDTSGCNYIKTVLPRLDAASRAINSGSTSSPASNGGTASIVFAWLFAATTVMFGAYAYFLYRKIKRGSVNLSAQEGV